MTYAKGPGDYGPAELADEEERESRKARNEAHDRLIEDAVADGLYDEED